MLLSTMHLKKLFTKTINIGIATDTDLRFYSFQISKMQTLKSMFGIADELTRAAKLMKVN